MVMLLQSGVFFALENVDGNVVAVWRFFALENVGFDAVVLRKHGNVDAIAYYALKTLLLVPICTGKEHDCNCRAIAANSAGNPYCGQCTTSE